MGHADTPAPDLTQGISLATLENGGMIVGRVGDDERLQVRDPAEKRRVANQPAETRPVPSA